MERTEIKKGDFVVLKDIPIERLTIDDLYQVFDRYGEKVTIRRFEEVTGEAILWSHIKARDEDFFYLTIEFTNVDVETLVRVEVSFGQSIEFKSWEWTFCN